MNILKMLDPNTSQVNYLTNSKVKQKLLLAVSNQKKLFQHRIFTPFDLQPILSPLATFTLFEQFGLPLEVSRKVIHYMPWIQSKDCLVSSKIERLYEMKQFLIDQGLYQENTSLGIQYTLLQDVRLKEISLHLNQDLIYLSDIQANKIEMHLSLDSLEMIQACMDKIYLLLQKGVLPEKIKIYHASSEDIVQLQKWFFLSQIPFEAGIEYTLTDFAFILTFLKEAKEVGLTNVTEKYFEHYPYLSQIDQQLFDQIIDIINDYPTGYFHQNLNYLQFILNQKKMKSKKVMGAVSIIGDDDIFIQDDEYLLVLNYEEDSFPRPLRDDDYITDLEKKTIGMVTSTQANEFNKMYLIEHLKRCKNLTLFHARFDSGKEMRLPHFDFSREISSIKYEHHLNKYSESIALLTYKKYEERYRKFHIPYPQMEMYRSVFHHQLNNFDPKFSGLNQSTVDQIIHNKVLISPTSLSVFYQCPFEYLIQYLLKISPFKKTVSLYFGNLTHRLLEVLMNQSAITRKDIIFELKDDFPDEIAYKRELYTKLFLEQFDQMIPHMMRFQDETEFENDAFEESIKYTYEQDPRFSIYGKIDRTMVYHNQQGEAYLALIDYKTSTKKFNPKLFEQGIDVQLPFYQHLIAMRKDHAHVFGLYIQNLHFGRLPYGNQDKTIADSLRFHGITLDHMEVIKKFGIDYIQGVALKSDGSFTKNSKVYSIDTFAEYQNIMKQLIDKMIRIIKQGDFHITPKGLLAGEEKVNSCEYCSCHALCYKGALSSFQTEEEEKEETHGFN